MSTTFLSVSIPPNEVEKLVDTAVDVSGKLFSDKFLKEHKDYRVEGTLRIDLRDAKANYRLGALKYGPIDALLTIKDFRVWIDWHNLFKIPKELCLEIKDPCGNTVIRECVHFDLGVTELRLTDLLPPIRYRDDVELLDVSFRDKDATKEYYALTGDLPLAATLHGFFGPGFIRGAVQQVGDLVERLLRSVFGNNPFADLLIALLKSIVAIVDLAIAFLTDIAKLALRPLDELLHKLFPTQLKIVLQEKGFPKNLQILSKSGDRPAVTIPITSPPRIELLRTGLEMEIYS